MKRALIIATVSVAVVLGAVLLHENAHYAEKGQTKVDLRFLGFTNSSTPTVRLARFAVSNESPWSIVQLEYPSSETHRKVGEDVNLVHSFEGGPRLWRAGESGVTLVPLQKVEGQERWRLIAGFNRYEDPVVANLHRLRFFLSDYTAAKVPRWDHVKVVTEWIWE
jgi:hypothetical protein